jgi:hypothetical protein
MTSCRPARFAARLFPSQLIGRAALPAAVPGDTGALFTSSCRHCRRCVAVAVRTAKARKGGRAVAGRSSLAGDAAARDLGFLRKAGRLDLPLAPGDRTRVSLIPGLIRLRPEPSGAAHAGQGVEVMDPSELRRTQARRLGKRVGDSSPPTTGSRATE